MQAYQKVGIDLDLCYRNRRPQRSIQIKLHM